MSCESTFFVIQTDVLHYILSLYRVANKFSDTLNELFVVNWVVSNFFGENQRYTYRVLQTIQMKLILLWVWAEPAVLGGAKTALKFKYEI